LTEHSLSCCFIWWLKVWI